MTSFHLHLHQLYSHFGVFEGFKHIRIHIMNAYIYVLIDVYIHLYLPGIDFALHLLCQVSRYMTDPSTGLSDHMKVGK